MIDYKNYIDRLINIFPYMNFKSDCDKNEIRKILEKVFIEYGNKKNYEFPRVGVGIIIEKDNKVLLIKRKNIIGNGLWSFPGGKMEKYESIEETAIRETKEEVDLDIFNIKLQHKITNDIWINEDQHYITLYVKCDFNGEPKIMEKDKCSDIGWFDWNQLPNDLFLPFKNYLKNND